jgi:antitoxin HicB
MSELNYPISIRPLTGDEGRGYLAEFPDLPGCIADGETVEEALHAAEDALQSWLKTAEEFGDPIPKPSLANQYSGQWRLRLPKSLHAALALQAKREGVSLNTLAATLLAQGLGQKLSQISGKYHD